jgi:hypothetical protein
VIEWYRGPARSGDRIVNQKMLWILALVVVGAAVNKYVLRPLWPATTA